MSSDLLRALGILALCGGLAGCQAARSVGLPLGRSSTAQADFSSETAESATDSQVDTAAHTESQPIAAAESSEQETSRWAKLFGFGKPKRIPLPRTDLDSSDVFGDPNMTQSLAVDEF